MLGVKDVRSRVSELFLRAMGRRKGNVVLMCKSCGKSKPFHQFATMETCHACLSAPRLTSLLAQAEKSDRTGYTRNGIKCHINGLPPECELTLLMTGPGGVAVISTHDNAKAIHDAVHTFESIFIHEPAILAVSRETSGDK